jgi:hypothetical protein
MFGERIDGVEALAGIAVVGGVLIGSLPLRLPRRRPAETARLPATHARPDVRESSEACASGPGHRL